MMTDIINTIASKWTNWEQFYAKRQITLDLMILLNEVSLKYWQGKTLEELYLPISEAPLKELLIDGRIKEVHPPT